MKNIFIILASVFLFLMSNPILAQADPGADPEPVVPIDGYVYMLAAIGLVFVFLKLRALTKKGNTTS